MENYMVLEKQLCNDAEQIEAAQAQLVESHIASDLAELFKTLSDPTRLRIISLLRGQELCVHTISTLLEVSQSAVSHQLRDMRNMRLVRFRKVGRHVYYTLDDEHVADLFQQGLLHIEHH
jgi:DNA-binding transcriptional ArsR family regulator